MSTMPSRPGVTETYLPMLHGAQAYLKAVMHRIAPDSLVSEAWEEFYRLYDDLIRRFVVAQGIPASEVDDCVQEVWTEVTTRLMEFDRPADRPGLRSWLYALVRSKATNVYRRKLRRPTESLEEAIRGGCEPDDSRGDPVALLDERWERAIRDSVLERLRSELSPTNARILDMRLIEHRDVSEVAERLNLSPAHVHARQHRIIKKLRARVAVYTGAPIGS